MNEFISISHKILPEFYKINEDIWKKIPSSFWNKISFASEIQIKKAGITHVLNFLQDEITYQFTIDNYS